ncbi:MAG: nitroreductase [Desulfobulbaceae bacterium]
MDGPVQDAIRRRRSVREFTDEPVTRDDLLAICEAGIWAPSGLNNQPWRFILVRDEEVGKKLARFTTYSHIILGAPALIVVFLDREAMYNEVKDHQAAGACIQNMLLATAERGFGAVWLGQILQNSRQVNELFSLGERYELMAVLAIGRPRHTNQQSQRKPLADFILQEIGGDQA